MNERIRELALEAFQPINDIASEGIADHRTFDQAWFQLYNQKFAELLIRECTNMLPEDSIRNADGVHMFYVIREHFGVEE